MLNQVKLDPKNYPFNIRQMFVRRFQVEVPSIALKGINELRERGIYAVGEDDKEHTRHANSPVETFLQINRCFEIWKAGYQVSVIKPGDTLEIFNIITLHLQTWVSYMDRGIQIADAPFEDLLLLDRFADKIYPHARQARANNGIHYFKDSMSNLGFNLNPTTQLGTQSFFMSLGAVGGNGGRVDLTNVDLTEDREGFGEEITRLGGKLSQAMREQERASLFNANHFGMSVKAVSK